MKSSPLLVIATLLTNILMFYGTHTFAQEDTLYAYEEINNIAYYEGKGESSEKQKLNLVIPKGIKNFPLLVWIGGGAWSYVDRNMEMDLARKFARQGIAVAAIGHRLSPATWKDPALTQGIRHPEHIKDVARAYKWLYDHASSYGYSPGNIFVGGYSSGGHLAALLSTDDTYLKREGLNRNIIKSVIPVAGTYDIPHYYQVLADAYGKHMADSHVKGVFGETQQDFKNASPSSYVQQLSVPMLLISETNTYRYTKVFEDKLKQTGFTGLTVIHFGDIDHSALWKQLSSEEHNKYRQLIVNYIKAQTAL